MTETAPWFSARGRLGWDTYGDEALHGTEWMSA